MFSTVHFRSVVQSLFTYKREKEGGGSSGCLQRRLTRSKKAPACPASVHLSDGKSCGEAADLEESRETQPETHRKGRREEERREEGAEGCVFVKFVGKATHFPILQQIKRSL